MNIKKQPTPVHVRKFMSHTDDPLVFTLLCFLKWVNNKVISYNGLITIVAVL